MALQTGTDVIYAFKKEVTFGTLPANDSSAKQLRRLAFGLGLKKDAIRSAEKRSDGQRAGSRHAMRKVDGNIEAELSLGTYTDFIGSALRKDFAAVSSLSALTNITASASAPQFVRAAGSWITDGLRVGMTVRMTGWTTTGTGNNSKNFTIIALTATDMTVAETVAAKASGDSVVVSIPGKVSYTPATGRTLDSYSFEQWASAAVESRRFLGQRCGGFNLSLPPNDKASITFNWVGQNRASATSQHFTSATAAGTSQMQTGLSASIWINGVAQTAITNLQLEVTNGLEAMAVVGSNLTPDVFVGAVEASGSFSLIWADDVVDGYFDDETPVTLVIQLRDTTASNSDVMNLTLPNVLLSGGGLPDSEKAMVQTFQFTAGVGPGTSGYQATTLYVQDTLAP